METVADTSAFNAGVKENNTKTNKITIVKNQKLATQNFLFNMHIHFPCYDFICKEIFVVRLSKNQYKSTVYTHNSDNM
jgi:hypothetical protein